VANWGGYWTEVKLDVLSKYLSAFNNASRSANSTVYLDLFGGSLSHTLEQSGKSFPGSTARALRTKPPFSRLVFWELDAQAAALKSDLEEKFPGDDRYKVVAGDCNRCLEEGLESVKDLRWAPTFAFVDPKGLDVEWTTLEKLSKWRRDKKERKVEMWILVPEPAFARVLGLKGTRGEGWPEQLTGYFGTDEWIAIYQRRQSGEFGPERTRDVFVNLLRWRLEKVLGYQWTHDLKLTNVSDQPIYTMQPTLSPGTRSCRVFIGPREQKEYPSRDRKQWPIVKPDVVRQGDCLHCSTLELPRSSHGSTSMLLLGNRQTSCPRQWSLTSPLSQVNPKTKMYGRVLTEVSSNSH
jgi:three-Cys-motif partner protein